VARPLRPDYTDTFHHVVIRGVDGLPIFDGDGKRVQFLSYLKEARRSYDIRLYAFGFLPNHWHGFMRRGHGSMARYFQTVKSRYAVWYNRTYSRTGGLYDGRYFSSIVEAESYFQKVWSYVQNQGIAAGLYNSPEEDPGSTAGLYAGKDDQYDWIDWEEALEFLDIPVGEISVHQLKASNPSDDLPIRRERDQRFIAEDDFIETYMQIRKGQVRESQRDETPLTWETLLKVTKEKSEFSVNEILKESKQRDRHRIRCGLAYAARRYGHKSTKEIAEKLNVSPATVSRMVKKATQKWPEIKYDWVEQFETVKRNV